MISHYFTACHLTVRETKSRHACESRDADGKGRWSVKNDPLTPPTISLGGASRFFPGPMWAEVVLPVLCS